MVLKAGAADFSVDFSRNSTVPQSVNLMLHQPDRGGIIEAANLLQDIFGIGHGGLSRTEESIQAVEQHPMSVPTVSVRDLRRLWKPHKQRLSEKASEHSTNIRFHRACSWLQRAEQATESGDLDFALLSQWTAFNALYGQWDDAAQEPVPDGVCWRHFVDRMLDLDAGKLIADALIANKPLAMLIFDDEYLSRYFWQEPSDKRAGQAKKAKFDARTWYLQGAWTLVLDRLIERIYLLRCQFVHGAATYNSSLNRTATRHCSLMMDHVIRAFLLVWISNGADEDWGIMCYPPQRSKVTSRPSLRNDPLRC